MIQTTHHKKGAAFGHCTTHLARTMRSLSIDTVEGNSSATFPVGLGSLHSPIPSLIGGLRMAQEFRHTPVLLEEVTELFSSVPAGVVIDATLGGAGHAAALLASRGDLGVLGIDRDPVARAAAAERLAPFGPRASIASGRFGDVAALVGSSVWPQVPGVHDPAPLVGILADLGVSSPQLDVAARGFSYSSDGPLDMRMDASSGRSAATLLEEIDLDALTQLLREHGETRHARRIAVALKAALPITTTAQLVAVVDGAVPRAGRRRGNVAARTFQALRVAVNEEESELAALLDFASTMETPGARIAIISYHSGEDALVKHTFRAWAEGECTCPPGLPCVCGATSRGTLVARRSIRATDQEVATNPRASSGHLRCFEVAR